MTSRIISILCITFALIALPSLLTAQDDEPEVTIAFEITEYPDGADLSKARILYSASFGDQYGPLRLLEVEASGEASFSFPWQYEDRIMTILASVWHPEFQGTQEIFEVTNYGPDDEVINFTLSEYEPLKGKLTYPEEFDSDVPVEIHVHMNPLSNGSDEPDEWGEPYIVNADEEGNFEVKFAPLEMHRYRIDVMPVHPEWEGYGSLLYDFPPFRAFTDDVIPVTLRPKPMIEIKLVDEDGEPVAGLEVRLLSKDDEDLGTYTTNSEGILKYPEEYAGRLKVEILSEDFGQPYFYTSYSRGIDQPISLVRMGDYTVSGNLSDHLDTMKGQEVTVRYEGMARVIQMMGGEIEWKTRGEVVVAEDGTFSFENLYPGGYSFILEGDTVWGGNRLLLNAIPGEAKDKSLNFELRTKYTLSGQFVDKVSGQPVTGIALQNSSIDRRYWWMEQAPIVTDEQGRVSIPIYFYRMAQSNEELYSHNQQSARFPVVSKPEDVSFPGNSGNEIIVRYDRDFNFTVDVFRGLRVYGQVLLDDGETPASGAKVLLEGPTRENTVTDEKGEFSFAVPPRSNFKLSVEHPLGKVSESFSLGNEVTDRIVLTLSETAAVSGYVYDAAGNPVDDVGVAVGRMHNNEFYPNHRHKALTDLAGKFFIADLPAGEEHFIGVMARGENLFLEGSLQPIILEPGEVRSDFDFNANLDTFRGTIVNQEGAPVANAGICFTYSRKPFVTTNQDGYFLVSGMSGAKPQTFRIIADGYPDGRINWIPFTPEEEYLLERGDASIFIKLDKRGEFEPAKIKTQLRETYYAEPTEEEDVWRFDDLPIGKHDLRFVALDMNGEVLAKSRGREVDLKLNEEPPLIHVELIMPEVPVTIKTVNKISGGVVADAKIEVTDFAQSNEPLYEYFTGADGTASFELKQSGSYFYVATAYGMRGVASGPTVPSKEGRFDITIEMEPTKTLRGRLLDYTGEPISGVRVYFDGVTHSATTDETGHFEISDIPNGEIRLAFHDLKTDSRYSYVGDSIELDEELNVVWKRTVTYIGQLYVNGEPALADNRFRFYSPDAPGAVPQPVDKGGYIAELYPNNTYKVYFNMVEGGEFLVEPSDDATVKDFYFEYGSVSILVEGTAPPLAKLVRFQNDKVLETRTLNFDAPNRIEVTYIPPGTYQWKIAAHNKTYGISDPVEIVAGERAIAIIEINEDEE